ncbi:deoxyribodipyrimidine photo-lyase, partial [bacterium]|nr:deoxyribodipyrimidine photo-lyase [bacterium]
MPHQVGLFLFKNDLRVDDNPALARAAAEVDQLICLYCLESRQTSSRLRAPGNLSPQRQTFLSQSLADLHNSLTKFGQRLNFSTESPLDIIPQLITQYDISQIYCSENTGDYENQ